ncbi:unnamed protein product [Thelazia callipaeda]|uniref:TSP1_CCN domain-containing protein n=1 Tax=Thelazia callipaeda TaxID=103827 RepID=A0A0N5D809_THECL|nr:unnamed protein product [Thelazia callipaeda]
MKSQTPRTSSSGGEDSRLVPKTEDLTMVPDQIAVDQKTEIIPEEFEFEIGEDTAELSDVSEVERVAYQHAITPDTFDSHGAVYHSQRSGKFLLSMHSNILYYTKMANLFINTYTYVESRGVCWITLQISSIMKGQKVPCLYKYGDWSPCTQSCWDGLNPLPKMFRSVNKSSVVQSRGGEEPLCPPDLLVQVDIAPCNTHLCPTPLSSYDFTSCYYKDAVKEKEGGCYKIRNVTLDNRLINIDTELVEDCSDKECDSVLDLI